MDREWSVFEMAQFFAQSALDELTAAMAARGYTDISMSGIRLCWACSDGNHSVAELAARLGVTKQFCAREVAKLGKGGYLEISPDPDDARALSVRLSAKGYRLLEDAGREKAALEKRLDAKLGRERMRAFRETLKRLSGK